MAIDFVTVPGAALSKKERRCQKKRRRLPDVSATIVSA
jgi:hypothetical protein